MDGLIELLVFLLVTSLILFSLSGDNSGNKRKIPYGRTIRAGVLFLGIAFNVAVFLFHAYAGFRLCIAHGSCGQQHVENILRVLATAYVTTLLPSALSTGVALLFLCGAFKTLARFPLAAFLFCSVTAVWTALVVLVLFNL